MDPLSFDNEQVPISPVSIDYLIKNEIQNDENITERNIEYIDTEIVEQNIIDSLNSDGEFDSTEIDIMDFDPVKSELAELHEKNSLNDDNSRSVENSENESISFQDDSQDVAADSVANADDEVDGEYSFGKFLDNFCVFDDAESMESEIHSNTRLNDAKREFVTNEIGECTDSIIEEECFKCDICMKEYDDSYRLKKHKKTHESIKPYKCQFCPKTFADSGNRKTHERIHTGARPFACNICLLTFSNQSSCIRHTKRCKVLKQNENRCGASLNKQIFKCTMCFQVFVAKYDLEIHMLKMHTGEKPFKCKYCSMAFAYKMYRTKHERIHTGEKPYKCLHCPYKAIDKSSVNRHMKRNACFSVKSHLKFRMRQDVIEMNNESEANLEIDQVGKNGSLDSQIVCGLGEKSTYDQTSEATLDLKLEPSQAQQDLNRHMHSENGPKKPFQCEFCDKSFDANSYLIRHRRIHTGEKPFKCKYCSTAFANEFYRTKHERIHTGEKPYKCLNCSYRATDKSSVNRHMKRRVCFSVNSNRKRALQQDVIEMNNESDVNVEIDQEERNGTDLQIVCGLVEKSTYDQTSELTLDLKLEPSQAQHDLNRHMHSENGPMKPFQCEFCDKSFDLNAYLIKHQRIHSGEKPFKCKYCSMAFTYKMYRKKHERIHTGEKPYKCLHCPYRAIDKSSVNRHMKRKVCFSVKSHVKFRMRQDVIEMNNEFDANVEINQEFDKNSSDSHQIVYSLEENSTFDQMQATDPLLTSFETPKLEAIEYQPDTNFPYTLETVNNSQIVSLQCAYCDRTFDVASELKNHFREHIDEKLSKIFQDTESASEKCTNATESNDKQMTEIENQTELNQFSSLNTDIHKCTHCDKQFKEKWNLRRHLRTHSGVKPHLCRICGKCFTEAANRRSHELTHSDGMPFECKFCLKKFRAQSSCIRHRRRCEKRMQNDAEMPISNETNSCSGTYKEESIQFIEQNSISNEPAQISSTIEIDPSLVPMPATTKRIESTQTFKCMHCALVFYAGSELQQHLRIHSVERPYTCRFCEKTFIDECNRKSHELTHSDATPFECEFCSKQFKTNSSRIRHKKMHCSNQTNANKTQCSNVHERIHNNDRPHECNICFKRFTTKPNLNAHFATHSNEKPFKCGKCDKAYKTYSSCSRHRVMEHGRS